MLYSVSAASRTSGSFAAALGLVLALAGCRVAYTNERPTPPARRAPARASGPAPARAASPGVQRPPIESDEPKADPEASRLFLATAAEPASVLSVAAQPPRVTAIALDNTALSEARGMQPGALWGVVLAEGARATTPVSLAPGECATYVAQGGLGVLEIDLFVTTGSGPSLRLLAEDPTSGPIAVLGGRAGCFRNPRSTPMSGALHVRMRRGGGVVLVRAYAGR